MIKKSEYVVINNEIGRLFKGHNVLGYKSPEDAWGWMSTISHWRMLVCTNPQGALPMKFRQRISPSVW